MPGAQVPRPGDPKLLIDAPSGGDSCIPKLLFVSVDGFVETFNRLLCSIISLSTHIIAHLIVNKDAQERPSREDSLMASALDCRCRARAIASLRGDADAGLQARSLRRKAIRKTRRDGVSVVGRVINECIKGKIMSAVLLSDSRRGKICSKEVKICDMVESIVFE